VAGGGASPAWCRALTCRQLAGRPDAASHLFHSDLDPHEGTAAASVAMVRVSGTRGIWLAALRFRPAGPFTPADVRLMAFVRRLLLAERRHARARAKLEGTVLGLVRSLGAAINAKNPYTSGHSERVARIAVRLGRQMGLPPDELANLFLAGLLHDVGKIGVRSNVLDKPGRLTESEYGHVCEHPVIGDAVVGNVPELAELRPGVRHHHERYDGTGYPDRLAGEAIPLLARILAVADACDAMASPRPYRPPLPPARVDATLQEGAGTQWDPRVVASFLACRDEVYALCRKVPLTAGPCATRTGAGFPPPPHRPPAPRG
jgi:HD-GYP domain-containing protein (c-di-GMP phosphodiesterase class II)